MSLALSIIAHTAIPIVGSLIFSLVFFHGQTDRDYDGEYPYKDWH